MSLTNKYLLQGVINKSKAISHQVLTINNGGTGVVHSLTVPDNARYAIVTVEAGDQVAASTKVLRFWTDGSNPTADEGHLIGDGGVFDIAEYSDLNNTRIIAIDNADSKLMIQYYR